MRRRREKKPSHAGGQRGKFERDRGARVARALDRRRRARVGSPEARSRRPTMRVGGTRRMLRPEPGARGRESRACPTAQEGAVEPLPRCGSAQDGSPMDTSNGAMRSRDLAGLPRARPHIDPHIHDTNARLKSGRKASHRARRGGRRARRTLVCGPARKKGDEYDGGKSRVRRAAGGALTEPSRTAL